MKRLATILMLAVAVTATAQQRLNEDYKQRRKASTENKELKAPEYIPFSLGAIKPEGWLKEWADMAADGITGHLDERNVTFEKGWTGEIFTGRGIRKDATGWPLEQCAYWLDGAVRLAWLTDNKPLQEKTRRRMNIIVDSILSSPREAFVYWTDAPVDSVEVKQHRFNNWACSHMARAMLGYYQATGDGKVVEALLKGYKHMPTHPYINQRKGHSGFAQVEPMLEMYRLTGRRSFLDSLRALSKNPTFVGRMEFLKKNGVQPDHGVAISEDMRFPAELYLATGDRSLLEVSQAGYDTLRAKHLLPYGAFSSEEHTAGIGATRHTESCNITTAEWSYEKMLEITGELRYADYIEAVFINGASNVFSRDMQLVSYYQAPNHVEKVFPADIPHDPYSLVLGTHESYFYREFGHEVLCCAGNSNRIIPYYIMHMWLGTKDRGVLASLYGPSRFNGVAGAKDIPVEIIETTDYPYDETVTFEINPEKAVRFPLYLRIPAWCSDYELEAGDGARITKEGQSVRIDRKWEKGDKVTLRLKMEIRVETGCETPFPQTPHFRKNRPIAKITDINSPYACVYYGPLLMALPLKDATPNTQVGGQKWNYALVVDKVKNAKIIRRPISQSDFWRYDAPVALETDAVEFDWQPTPVEALPKEKVKGGKPAKIVLTPYASSKFHISMFPVAE
ncbi:MAG: glycoside hydrolase family 127 protein [Alistipes sp.]|nr:glycoside hydrolase family 127 protein [Alistipes sp.]